LMMTDRVLVSTTSRLRKAIRGTKAGHLYGDAVWSECRGNRNQSSYNTGNSNRLEWITTRST
jgi:hypothetical protein